jgi:clan AA aspartic protease (TIGR02281 family)
MRTLFILLSFLVCASISSAQTVIQMEKKGGVYYVPCTVNGLKLSFIFDTGASNVSISMSEALFMLKNGYLSEDDLLGTESYQIANGDVAEGTKINLRSIVIGGKELRNVKASIVHSATAPLLLGQSVLERFGNVSINYSNQTLVLGGGAVATQPQPSKPSTASDSKYGELYDQRDGKTYKTVKIGNQVWMAENLAYRPPTGNYWAYDNDPKNVATYGYLYDWETAKRVCPAGWHLPSDAEWTTLTDYLGGKEVAGKKMKSRTGWLENGNGTDESGFSGLPGGYRQFQWPFLSIDSDGYWWSSTETNSTNAWLRNLYHYSRSAYNRYEDNKTNGVSVRCLRD